MTTKNAVDTFTVELTWEEMMTLRRALNARSVVLGEEIQKTHSDENRRGYETEQAKAASLWHKVFKIMN